MRQFLDAGVADLLGMCISTQDHGAFHSTYVTLFGIVEFLRMGNTSLDWCQRDHKRGSAKL